MAQQTPAALNLDKILNPATTHLSPISIRNYKNKIKLLENLMKHDINWIIDHPRKTVKAIKAHYQENQTRKAFIAAIRTLFKHDETLIINKTDKFIKWEAYAKEANEAVQKWYTQGEATPRQKENFVDWPTINQTLSKLTPNTPEHLLLAMYTLEEPKRQDYGALKILKVMSPQEEAQQKGNYLIMYPQNIILVMNDYKTSKTYKQFRKTLSPELTHIIKESLNSHPRSYLFQDKSGNPFKDKAFANYSNRILFKIFKKNVTVSLLRHSYIQYMYNQGTTHNQRYKMSKSMGHSIAMQSQYAFEVGEKECKVTCKELSQGRG